MNSSYCSDDVEILLKDITGLVEPLSTKERERFIQAGKQYCEMLPIEYSPSETYLTTYKEALRHYSKPTALAIGVLADKIIKRKGRNVVLVSLARAGIPIGILLKRYIKRNYDCNVTHYAISIIRGRGIDKNAIKHILKLHKPEDVQFVDGWIGKGAIQQQLEKDVSEFFGMSSELAVVADPANITSLCGTHEDLLIPNSCLNSTVSGLISRTFLREDIIKEQEFHGAVYYEELKEQDLSYDFIKAIESQFENDGWIQEKTNSGKEIEEKTNSGKEIEKEIEKESNITKGIDEVKKVARSFNIPDINLIKPGIGETTRVLLRRVPWKVLINESYKDDRSLNHIINLCKEKGVSIEYYPLLNYKTCGIIKKLADA